MIELFSKREGTFVDFDRTKIDRWAEYAARHGVDGDVISTQTISRLPPKTSAYAGHETMTKVCLDYE